MKMMLLEEYHPDDSIWISSDYFDLIWSSLWYVLFWESFYQIIYYYYYDDDDDYFDSYYY